MNTSGRPAKEPQGTPSHNSPVSTSAHPTQSAFALPLSPARISRDEMNLAEFPITMLSTRSDPSIKTLEFSDSVKGKNGDLIERKWIITGADKFGLPTASDDEVLLGLLKATVDDGFRERKVFFTRYELLRTLRWTTEGRSYQRLQRALDRLSGVRIKASNGFYDNESKTHSTRNFGIIDAYEINDGRDADTKPSFFIWSEVMFRSFQAGFIKKLNLDFYLDLKSAVSKRIYRFLDKHFWYRSRLQMNLFIFAHEKIGISRNYKHVSSIRQQLDGAFEELIKCGFISSVEYVGKGRDAALVVCAAKQGSANQRMKTQGLPEVEVVSGATAVNTREEVQAALEQRGLDARQVTRLVADKDEKQLQRMKLIMQHVDQLIASGSRLVSRSPKGFLYRAVENPDRFVLPGEQRFEQTQRPLPLTERLVDEAKRSPTVARVGESAEFLKTQYLIERKKEVQQLLAEIEPALLEKVRSEVTRALEKLRTLISPERFAQAVEHGVEEKLLALFKFPSFEEYSRTLKNRAALRSN